MEALRRGGRATPDEATQKWIEAAMKTLNEWDRTRIWIDTFNRQPSSEVGNGWRKTELLGINIGVNGDHAVFASGNAGVKAAANGRPNATMLDREEDLGRFHEMTARMKPCPDCEMSFTLHMGPPADHPNAGNPRSRTAFEFGLGCDRHGMMVLWTPHSRLPGATEVTVKDSAGNPRPWPMDDVHAVRIVRTDDVKGVFEVWLDNEKISVTTGPAEKPVTQSSFDVPALNAQPGKTFVLGFIVDADAGAQVDAEVDDVQVTKIYK
jgi:hypothetical protein